ncbi:hypothetical protein LEL86_05960 [Streptomyces sp. WA6-1-16]|uniref:hypothetical protein n=1 Tax=Streptomyces sp. WA6-1-16 TaxID=2879427 RepID=UPI001CE2EF46|nr:hypothetical protein [Streptomyces sp. WA6-1-16]UCA48850.1 hypothetical protein LEL86_05960 [Streptomyces sp. WA6-1-16]
MIAVAYRIDVEFLELCNPALIDRNAQEYRRLHQLLESADGAFLKASRTEWVSEANDLYKKRLREAENLANSLSAAFRKSWAALADYAEAVGRAKKLFESGKSSEASLSQVMSRVAQPVTETAQRAEPMRQWEDLRKRTGVLDWLAEITVDVDEIREEAERHYNATADAYGDALRIEREARSTCVAELKKARRSLPEFRGDLPDPSVLLAGMPAFRQEVAEAKHDPNVALAGAGPKVDEIPANVGSDRVSPKLQDIRSRLDGLPTAMDHNRWLLSNSDAERQEWIRTNSEHIKDAAAYTGLPADMIAGIAWQEVQGDPKWFDDVSDQYRQHQYEVWPEFQWVAEKVGLGGEADQTSMGPIAIQIRRSAEVLGYDPENMTQAQRDEVEKATQDPATNVYIASEYLAQLKAESSFANVPADRMTPAQYQELAARYNGGPYWQTDDAQAYGRGFTYKLDDARQALG